MHGCHTCRNVNPMEAMVVDMRRHGVVPDFEGMFEVIIHAATEEKTTRQRKKKIEAIIPLKLQNSKVFIAIS